jgi:putative hydrolase of the HAD superfamily
MNQKLSNVKHIWWDLDDTLYPFNQEFHDKKIKVMVAEFARLKGIPVEEAEKQFKQAMKKYKSSAETFKNIFDKPNYYAQQIQGYVDRAEYIKYNPELVEFFRNFLKKHPAIKHSIISNSLLSQIKLTLRILKLPEEWFANLASSEHIGASKPNEKIYKTMIDLSGLKPGEIAYVGDREEVDIIPAKKLGIVTILVSDGGINSQADFKVDSVYDILELFD